MGMIASSPERLLPDFICKKPNKTKKRKRVENLHLDSSNLFVHDLTIPELKRALKLRKLSVNGKKAILAQRLEEGLKKEKRDELIQNPVIVAANPIDRMLPVLLLLTTQFLTLQDVSRLANCNSSLRKQLSLRLDMRPSAFLSGLDRLILLKDRTKPNRQEVNQLSIRVFPHLKHFSVFKSKHEDMSNDQLYKSLGKMTRLETLHIGERALSLPRVFKSLAGCLQLQTVEIHNRFLYWNQQKSALPTTKGIMLPNVTRLRIHNNPQMIDWSSFPELRYLCIGDLGYQPQPQLCLNEFPTQLETLIIRANHNVLDITGQFPKTLRTFGWLSRWKTTFKEPHPHLTKLHLGSFLNMEMLNACPSVTEFKLTIPLFEKDYKMLAKIKPEIAFNLKQVTIAVTTAESNVHLLQDILVMFILESIFPNMQRLTLIETSGWMTTGFTESLVKSQSILQSLRPNLVIEQRRIGPEHLE